MFVHSGGEPIKLGSGVERLGQKTKRALENIEPCSLHGIGIGTRRDCAGWLTIDGNCSRRGNAYQKDRHIFVQ